MPKEDYDDDDDELSPGEEGFLKGYKDASKKRGVAEDADDGFFEEEFEDEKLNDE